jgi:alkylation response protein AidB-like acyl-CoA dehydrogenase
MLKIWSQEAWQRLAELLLETGAEEAALQGVRDFGSAGNPVEVDALTKFYLSRPGTIAGGTSEVQRNILSRYILQLPV